MTPGLLRLGSRGSALARLQTEWVAARLDGPTALVWIQSAGDRSHHQALTAFGERGIFTAAVHLALLEDRIDVAVHSLKDLPTESEEGVLLACVPSREDPRDAWLSRDGTGFLDLPPGSRVGTGSPRRVAQLRRRRPDLTYVPIRGNVPTRIEHLRQGHLEALVLALAGLSRLGRAEEATEILDVGLCLPAPGQGALGLTIRASDALAAQRLAPLRNLVAAAATAAERSFLRRLGGGCQIPCAALAWVDAGCVSLRGRLLNPDGTCCLDATSEGALAEAARVGEEAAERILAQGGRRLLEST